MSNLAYLPKYTYQDYKLWEGDWELIEGYPVAMAPSPFGPHQAIVSNLSYQFQKAFEECRDHNCIVYVELDYIIDEATVVRPDLMITCKKVIDFVRTTPKVIVEVISPSSAIKDEKVKFSLYEQEGVERYILVYPELRKVRIFKHDGKAFFKEAEGIDGVLQIEVEGCMIQIDIDRLWELL